MGALWHLLDSAAGPAGPGMLVPVPSGRACYPQGQRGRSTASRFSLIRVVTLSWDSMQTESRLRPLLDGHVDITSSTRTLGSLLKATSAGFENQVTFEFRAGFSNL